MAQQAPNPQMMQALAQMMAQRGPGGPPGPPGGMPPGGPPGMPMPGPGGPPMMPPGGPPPMMPGGGMGPLGMPPQINPMTQPGMTDMGTNLLNQAASQLQAYMQNGPMDEHKAQIAQALQIVMRVMTGGTAMPSGAIHGSVTLPNPPPDPGGDFQIPNAPDERL